MRNWGPTWPPGRAERPAQPDLGAPLEHGDDHRVRDPDPADEQRDRAEAEEERVNALGRGRARLERVGRPGDVDLLGLLGGSPCAGERRATSSTSRASRVT